MALNTKNLPKASGGNNNTPPLEAGNYPARVVQVLDMGLQEQRAYQGKAKPPVNEIMITYELGTEFLLDDEGNEIKDKPRWISETMPIYSMEADLAKSTKRMQALDPKNNLNGDFSQIVGLPCTITVVQKPNKKDPERPYANVGGVTPPMKGLAVPKLVNEPKTFDLDEPDMDTFGSLPEWIQKKIKENLNYAGSALANALGGAPAKEEKAEEEDEDNPY